MWQFLWAVVSVALQPYSKTTAQYFVIDLKQSNKDMEDKMYYSITALSDIYGTGNNSSRWYLAATEKKSEKTAGELDFLFHKAET